MWIKTQLGELLNLDRSVTLGRFSTRAEADAYFNQLEKLLTKESTHD